MGHTTSVINDEHDERPSAIYCNETGEAFARCKWPADWDWFYNDDGTEREHTHREWAGYHGYKSVEEYLGTEDRVPCADSTCPCHTAPAAR